VALTEIQKAQVNKQLTAYCANSVPASIRSKLRIGYRIEGNAVILYEERPAFRPPHEWREMVVAKFKYVGTRREWRLYCQHRDFRWHSYEARPAAPSFAKLLDEVDADPTGIFWG
jgi:hypothetical protein